MPHNRFMEDNNSQNKLPLILWGALLSSQMVFMYVAINILHDPTKTMPNKLLPMILGFIALSNGGLSYWFHTMAKKRETMELFLTPFILSCALAESVHLFGLVGVAVGMDLVQYYGFVTTSILLFLLYFPKRCLT